MKTNHFSGNLSFAAINRRKFLNHVTLGCTGLLATSSMFCISPQAGKAVVSPACEFPWIRGTFTHVLNPPGMKHAREKNPREQWYINDHCIFVDKTNLIHWFGITNPYPEDGRYYAPGTHRHIGHASAKDPYGPWDEHPDSFSLPNDSKDGVGSCFVVHHGDDYFMLYDYSSNVKEGTNSARSTGLHMAQSKDLFTWSSVEDFDVLLPAYGTRDPCVIKTKEGHYLLYVTGGNESVGIIFLGVSSDMLHWEWREPALITDQTVGAGCLESPFVHFHNGVYYLFVNFSHRQYEETLIFTSSDPYHFDWQRPVCTLFAHAAEIFTWNGQDYITHCGIEDRHWSDTGAPYGLWLAELDWAQSKKTQEEPQKSKK